MPALNDRHLRLCDRRNRPLERARQQRKQIASSEVRVHFAEVFSAVGLVSSAAARKKFR